VETDYTAGFRGGSAYSRQATIDKVMNIIADEMQALKHNATKADVLLAVARIRRNVFDLSTEKDIPNGSE
jgi:hypothetical protein